MAATYNEEKIAKCSHIILDVEGTTTSITFVKDILFPYACDKAGAFLEGQWELEGVQEAVEGMRLQADKDIFNKVEGAVPIPDKDTSKEEQIKGVVDNFKWLISIDNKGTFMKKLSGLIWEKGYESGDIKGHVYNDVPPALESWQSMGKHIYIYSSGSVHAQKLLMKHSELGDLSARFTGNFDTVMGAKQEIDSYKNIIKNIDCQPEDVLFLTDIAKEAEAAHEAGMNVCLVIREGNAPLTEDDLKKFHTIKTFHEINLQPASSKRKQDEDQEESRPTKVAKTEEEKPEDSKKTDNVTEKEIVESMDTDKQAEETKSLETEEVKPTETETVQEKKTEEKESSDKEESMETDVAESKIVEEVKSVDEVIAEAPKETTPAVSQEKMEDDTKTEEITKIEKDKDTVEEVTASVVEEQIENDKVKVDIEKTGTEIDAEKQKKDETSTTEVIISEVEAIKPTEEIISEDIVSTPNLVDEESKSSLDNINVDIAVDADEEEKITDLLGAGEALDKECDDILSKVDQVTSKDIAVKPFIEKEIASKDLILDDAMEVISGETPAEIANTTELPIVDTNGKVEETKSNSSDIPTETSNNSHDTDKDIVKEPAKEETVDNKTENEVTPATESSNTEEIKTNGDSKECIENGSKSEVNGKESENGVQQNGSNGDTKQETNGANGESKKEEGSETVDIKSKKLPNTEEITPEQVAQEAET